MEDIYYMEASDNNSFMNKLKLKEALYLMSQGNEADPETVNQILAQILPKADFKQMILLRFKETILQVMTHETKAFELHPNLGLSFRGETATIYKLNRELNDRQVTFLLSPNAEQTEIHLAVEMNPPANYRVKLKLDGDTIETLSDLTKEKAFDSPITEDSAPELVFFEQNREIGRFHLILEID
ncbi:MAG: hypothetical protein SH817_14945 [Leptospira sp.]|nr:hypothetical protein [Leptospira sp.]